MKFQAILFDLDGTLLDTLTDLANSMNTVLVRLNLPTHPINSYRYFIGNGIERLVRHSLPEDHRDDKTVSNSLIAMQDEYSKHWIDNTKPYPGVPELLCALEKYDIPKAVLSNKPDNFTQIMTKKLLPDQLFNIVQGATPSIPKKPHPAAALRIAKKLAIPSHDFLYLGDTNTDMQTANSAGMYAVGVLWGFRDAEELLASGAKAIVDKPEDVLALL